MFGDAANRTVAKAQVIEELYLATLSRRPSVEEAGILQKELPLEEKKEEGFQDLFWALLNAKEFAFTNVQMTVQSGEPFLLKNAKVTRLEK